MPNYNKIFLILATLISANLWFDFLPGTLLSIMGGGLLFFSVWAWTAKNKTDWPQATLGILVILAIAGSAFFYLFFLGKLFIIASLFIIFIKTKGADIKFSLKSPSFRFTAYRLLLAAYLLLAALLLYFLAKSASDGTIASPWLLLPPYFLPLFFILTISAVALAEKYQTHLPLYFFLFFSVAAFIYKLGYGFDIFNHEAAVKYILEHGTISPKPFQYIGAYSAAIFFNRVAAVPPELFGKFFLPAAAALLPALAFGRLKKTDEISTAVPALAILLLPLSFLIVSTPQGIANLFLLFLILLALEGKRCGWLALAALLIHPIAGIAAFVHLAFIKFKNKKAVFAAGAVILPLIFIFLSYKISGQIVANFHIKETAASYINLFTFGGIKQNYNFWLDIFYFSKFFLLPAILGISIFTARKFKKEISVLPLISFFTLQAGFILMNTVADFSYLISYEQKNYPERLFYISFLFLAPYLILAAEKIYERLTSPTLPPPLVTKKEENHLEFSPLGNPRGELEGGFIYKIFFAGLFALLLTANFYLAYPRRDNYENDKGKNVASAMVSAVRFAEQDAGGKNYVVLTDQAVSAAALKTYGFKKYYSTPLGEVFYYPIPTGGPLYNEFLNLVYNNAGAKTARNAKILTGAATAYVILPSYWENYEKIKENLKTEMRVIFEDKNIVILK